MYKEKGEIWGHSGPWGLTYIFNLYLENMQVLANLEDPYTIQRGPWYIFLVVLALLVTMDETVTPNNMRRTTQIVCCLQLPKLGISPKPPGSDDPLLLLKKGVQNLIFLSAAQL